MNICVLSTSENVEAVRIKAREIEVFSTHKNLAIPLSSTGDMPPTHWFCTFKASEEEYQQIKELENLSEISFSEPKDFLQNKNLKIINVKKMVKFKKENDDT